MPLTVVLLILLGSAVLTQVVAAVIKAVRGRAAIRHRTAGGATDEVATFTRSDIFLLIATGLTIAAYAPVVGWMPAAWTRISRIPHAGFAIYLFLMASPLPPTLLAWCIASYWIFRFRLSRRLRLIWGIVLLGAVCGFPVSCLTAGCWSIKAPLEFRN